MTDSPPSLRIMHSLRYDFSRPVSNLSLCVRLRPRETGPWSCPFSQLQVRPDTDRVNEFRDDFGNHVNRLELVGPFQKLELTQVSRLEMRGAVAPTSTCSPGNTADTVWEELRQQWDPLAQSSTTIPATGRMADFSRPCFSAGRSIAECLDP